MTNKPKIKAKYPNPPEFEPVSDVYADREFPVRVLRRSQIQGTSDWDIIIAEVNVIDYAGDDGASEVFQEKPPRGSNVEINDGGYVIERLPDGTPVLLDPYSRDTGLAAISYLDMLSFGEEDEDID